MGQRADLLDQAGGVVVDPIGAQLASERCEGGFRIEAIRYSEDCNACISIKGNGVRIVADQRYGCCGNLLGKSICFRTRHCFVDLR